MNMNSSKSLKTGEQNVNEVSRISQGASLKGDIHSSSDIRVDGRVEGNIYSEGRIVVGETARVTGNVCCANADFWGRIDGDIYARDLLSFKGSAVVNGNVHMGRVQVEVGAQLNGVIKTLSEQEFDQLISAAVGVSAAPAAEH